MSFTCLAAWTTSQSHPKQTGEFSKGSLKCLTAGLKVEGKCSGISFLVLTNLVDVPFNRVFSCFCAVCLMHRPTTHLKIKRNLKHHFQLISLLKELTRLEDGKCVVVVAAYTSHFNNVVIEKQKIIKDQ